MDESAINATHPDDAPEDDAESFFGGAEEDGETQAAEVGVAEEAAEPAAAPSLEPEPEAAEPRSGPTPEAAAAMAGARELRERAEQAAEPEPTTPPAGEAEESAPSAAASNESEDSTTQGSANREYIVFQKLPLTERTLKHLLKEIEDGKAPAPRVAFFELHRAVTRNDRQAVAEAYKANKDVLGEKCDLAAVSSRSFKERHVEPRVVQPAQDISIT